MTLSDYTYKAGDIVEVNHPLIKGIGEITGYAGDLSGKDIGLTSACYIVHMHSCLPTKEYPFTTIVVDEKHLQHADVWMDLDECLLELPEDEPIPFDLACHQ